MVDGGDVETTTGLHWLIWKHRSNALIRAIPLLMSLAALLPASVFAGDEFSLTDVTLGMSVEEVNQSIYANCPKNCMNYGFSGPAGTFGMTVFLRFETEYFSNTRRHEVNRHRPFESVTFTFGPDRKVIAMQKEFYGSAKGAQKAYGDMSALYKGEVLSFTEQFPKTPLITTTADSGTTHSFALYDPGLTGKKFQVGTWPMPDGEGFVRMNYTDFDAVRRLEDGKPAEFTAVRGKAGTVVAPRAPSSYETENASKFEPLTAESILKTVDGSDTIEVLPENHDGSEGPPSKLMVNGVVLGKSGLLTDGMSFEGIQKVGKGLYRVNASWEGNGCSSQQEMVLRVVKGKGYLSEPFGRCEPEVTVKDGTVFFSFAETDYEPKLTLAVR
jgi:hypothetical protein